MTRMTALTAVETSTKPVPRLHVVPGARPAQPPLTESLTVALEADAGSALDALGRIDLAAPAALALQALGVGDRAALLPAVIGPAPRGGLSIGLVWRIDGRGPVQRIEPHQFDAFNGAGHVKVRWDVRVEPSAYEGAVVIVNTRFEATDEGSRARLLDAWSVVAPMAGAFAQRTARSVKAYAEEALAA